MNNQYIKATKVQGVKQLQFVLNVRGNNFSANKHVFSFGYSKLLLWRLMKVHRWKYPFPGKLGKCVYSVTSY